MKRGVFLEGSYSGNHSLLPLLPGAAQFSFGVPLPQSNHDLGYPFCFGGGVKGKPLPETAKDATSQWAAQTAIPKTRPDQI